MEESGKKSCFRGLKIFLRWVGSISLTFPTRRSWGRSKTIDDTTPTMTPTATPITNTGPALMSYHTRVLNYGLCHHSQKMSGRLTMLYRNIFSPCCLSSVKHSFDPYGGGWHWHLDAARSHLSLIPLLMLLLSKFIINCGGAKGDRYNSFGATPLIRGAAGVPLLTYGHSALNSRVKFVYLCIILRASQSVYTLVI